VKKRNPWLRKKNVKFASRKRRARIIFKFFLFLFLILGGIYGVNHLFKTLEFFSLKNIEIQGTPKSLNHDQILSRSKVELGTNLFKINIQNIKENLKEYPYFKSVSVQRRFPHTLVFVLQEYVPTFVLNVGKFFYVDEEGNIFKDISNTKDDRDFVVLSGFDAEVAQQETDQSKKLIQEAAKLKQAYQQFPFYNQIGLSEIHFEKNIGFTLYTEKKKYSIRVGLKDFSDKFKKLEEIWPKFEKMDSGVSMIDLNYPGKILMKM
jgi:cell division protein FtsQ